MNIYAYQGVDYNTTVDMSTIANLAEWEFFASASKLYSSNFAMEIDIKPIPASGARNSKNKIKLHIPAAETVRSTPGKYVYDVLMTNINTGEINKALEGILFIEQTITRL